MIKSIKIIVLLAFTVTTVFAQQQRIQNLPKYDKDRFQFGFALGLNIGNFKMSKNTMLFNHDSLYNIDNLKQEGFNLGIITDIKLSEYFNLRFIPTLSFVERDLQYTFYLNGKVQKPATLKKAESTYIVLPLYVKFKSERVNNMRAYVIAGGEYKIDMISQAKVENRDKQLVKLTRNDYGYTIGVGFDLYLEMFKLSPEIKMYNGLNNVLVNDPAIFTQSLHSLHSKVFEFTLLFQ